MTGPEHYREAERLLTAANRRIIGNDAEWLHPPVRRAELRAESQVHATLAVAEAYVAGAVMRPEDRDEWDRATGRLERAPATAGKGE